VDEHGNPVDEKPVISIYKSDTFVDLCRGPHLERTGEINPKAVKLMNVAGAYWRGDEHNPMLQRIYGTAWLSPKDLKQYLWRLEEAKKRDHRKLGKQLDLYSVSDAVGSGLVLWHPKGAMVRYLAERFWEDEHLQNGYEFVYTRISAKPTCGRRAVTWISMRRICTRRSRLKTSNITSSR
jgi:threonyl-tRNA synthetase